MTLREQLNNLATDFVTGDPWAMTFGMALTQPYGKS